MKKDPVLEALKKASKGLLYISETEAAVQPLAWWKPERAWRKNGDHHENTKSESSKKKEEFNFGAPPLPGRRIMA